jgi:hypothetical protein
MLCTLAYLEQVNSPDNIVLVVVERKLHGLPNGLKGSKMNDTVHVMLQNPYVFWNLEAHDFELRGFVWYLLEELIQAWTVQEVTLIESHLLSRDTLHTVQARSSTAILHAGK